MEPNRNFEDNRKIEHDCVETSSTSLLTGIDREEPRMRALSSHRNSRQNGENYRDQGRGSLIRRISIRLHILTSGTRERALSSKISGHCVGAASAFSLFLVSDIEMDLLVFSFACFLRNGSERRISWSFRCGGHHPPH